MGLIALCIFWLMVVRLWIVVGLRQPLIFIAIWFLSGLILGLVGLAPLFLAVEAVLVIAMVIIERKNSL